MEGLSQILSAIAGATVAGIFHLIAIKRTKKLTDLIDENDAFEVYSDSEAPDEIWNNFYKDFKSYNDPWKMELIAPEEYLNVHRARYQDPSCGNYKFLFFIKNDMGQFDRFVRFQAIVHLGIDPTKVLQDDFKQTLEARLKSSETPDTLKHIEVYLNDSLTPKQTFFRGYKKLKGFSEPQKVSLWYLSIDSETDAPHLILKSTDERFWNELDAKWNKAKKEAIKISGRDLFEQYLAIMNLNKKVAA